MDGDFKCARWRGPNSLLNQRVCRIILNSEIYHPKFLDYALPGYLKAINEVTSSVTVKHLSSKSIKEIPLPLPPFEAQNRIVAEIEKQFSRLDEAVANLKRVKANLKRYKAAVLKAAVEGKLTEEWRKQHPDVEPADKLLERILAERRKAAGKGKYKEPVGPDTSGLPELPAGWVWASYAQVGYLNLGRQRSPKYHSGQYMRPYLRVQNVFEDRIDLSDVMEMDFPPNDFEKYELKPGDLLLNEGQSPELLGRPAIYRGELPGVCFTNTLIRFRAVTEVSVEFALIVSRHNMRSGRFVDEGTITTNIAHLSLGRLATVEFPLPPLAEQHQIVAEVERRLSIVAGVEAQVDANLRRANRLRQSTLKQAFSGQLVLQDSNDEPASVLLERIRANANVGARHAVPRTVPKPASRTKTERPKRAQHAVPLQGTKPAAPDNFASLDAVLTAILGLMQPGQEYSRAELADALGLSTGRWNAAIQELKRRGQVRQVGEKRGARYAICCKNY
jgi:type I restriction enzyme S subunit